ncbi:CDC5 cell division cycle 5-like protein, partial [Lobulomyces angularis]
LVKGGVWKNTEDEILKAAVMKYGKNQWARISSLLVRKTPKQCKSRWYEWLDPSIRKTEWSQEEDEKLLHLAKLMPTQWRTIAPIVGRTPAQCLARYQKLLDEAEDKDNEEEGLTAEDVRKLRPGEIDPDPETKPARPDPVDMDEDEKEMLSEARARLANTQGKKAKRKAREKQLEEARRLATLQKRRELKAAGIDSPLYQKKKKKKKGLGMDYNADIPFYAKAPEGFWNTVEEKEKEDSEHKNMDNILLQKLEGKRKGEDEAELRKKDAKRQKRKKESGEYVSAQALKEAQEQERKISDRKKMILPAPLISADEMEVVVKLGLEGENIKQLVDAGDKTTGALLNDYSNLRSATPLRTPKVAAGEDSTRLMAKNLLAMTNAQTPLLGGDLETEGEIEFNGITPVRQVAHTPNPLAAHLTPRGNQSNFSATPKGKKGETPVRTPLRDGLGINTPMGSGFEETPRGSRQSVIRQQLSSLFARLPAPQNDFEIVLPEKENTELVEKSKFTEDEADVQARIAAEKLKMQRERMEKRSQAVQRDLPRPTVIRAGCFALEGLDDVQKLITEEMHALIKHDAKYFPVAGQYPFTQTVELEDFSLELLNKASLLVKKEFENEKKLIDTEKNLNEFCKLYKTYHDKYTFVPGNGKEFGTFMEDSKISEEQRVDIMKNKFEANKELMRKEAQKAAKLEKVLSVKLGGYQARSSKLKKDLAVTVTELESSLIELYSFQELKIRVEDPGLEERLLLLEKEVKDLEKLNNQTQQEYLELYNEKRNLLEN